MSGIEAALRFAAIGAGILAIVAPILALSRPWRNLGFERIDPSNRPARVILTAIFLVVLGVVLWRSVPLGLSEAAGLGLSVLGALLYFPAVGLYLWGLRSLGSVFRVSSAFAAKLPPDHEVVESGPYRFVRHPMYLGVIFAAAGALLIFRTWAMVLFFPLSFIVLARAHQEEAELGRRHGATWESYASRVAAWFPKVD
jgi:protein-S-isoprenylcysteine O-methyltransferase Ste14